MNLSAAKGCPLTLREAQFKPLIKWNGDVQPCQRLYDKIYCIGNLHNSTNQEIFDDRNPRLIDLSEIFSHRMNLMKANMCGNCALINECVGGCPARALDSDGCILSMDPDCVQRKLEYMQEYITHLPPNGRAISITGS